MGSSTRKVTRRKYVIVSLASIGIALLVVWIIKGGLTPKEPTGSPYVTVYWEHIEEDPIGDDHHKGHKEGTIVGRDEEWLIISAPWEALGFDELKDGPISPGIELKEYSLHVRLQRVNHNIEAVGFGFVEKDKPLVVYIPLEGLSSEDYGIDRSAEAPYIEYEYNNQDLYEVAQAYTQATGKRASVVE